MKWNVLIYDCNTKQIKEWNIFNHSSFASATKKLLDKCWSLKEFQDSLKRDLMYYFWSRTEYEVIVSAWPPMDGTERKIDIASQILMNWQHFTTYLWLTYKFKVPEAEDGECS